MSSNDFNEDDVVVSLDVKASGFLHLDLILVDEPIPLDELAHQRRNARWLEFMATVMPLDFPPLK